MENTKLNFAISSYCKENNLQNTFKALNLITTNVIHNHENLGNLSVVEIFEKYFAKELKGGLSFSFNLPNRLKAIRKRLGDNESNVLPMRKVKRERRDRSDRNGDIPEMFLLLLDELGLARKDAKLLYENKEKWRYVKSDMQLYCADKGKLVFFNLAGG